MSLAPPQLHRRLLRWPREQLISDEYDELASCLMVADRTADPLSVPAHKDDLPKMYAGSRGKAGWQLSEASELAGLAIHPPEQPQHLGGLSRDFDRDVPLLADEWIRRLSSPGRAYDEAVAQLHELLLRAARSQVGRMREAAAIGAVRREEIIHSAADEATMSVLSKLSTFEGRSAFTTWAYKFGILQAGTEVRRAAWRDREINVDDVPEQHQKLAPSPEMYAEGRDLAHAVREGLRDALTPHQRRVAVAVLIDEVPIDVLAERLGVNRNALYKTLHDARQRLRTHLSDRDFLLPATSRKEATS